MDILVLTYTFKVNKKINIMPTDLNLAPVFFDIGDTYIINEFQLNLFPYDLIQELEHNGYIELIKKETIPFYVDIS